MRSSESKVRHPARIGHRHHPVELPEVAGWQRNPLVVREAPHDVGGNRPTEMRVELSEAVREQRVEAHW
jgi:hypothetical protein